MPPDSGARTDWESAAALLRRRGYLGGEDGGGRPPGTGVAGALWFAALAALLALGAALAGTVPPAVASLAWITLLLAPLLGLVLGLVTAALARAFEWRHRAGMDVGRASAAVAAGGALAAGGAWLWLTWDAPADPWSLQRLAGAALALAAAAGTARFAGHRLAARLLRRSPASEIRLPAQAWAIGAAATVLLAGTVLLPKPAERNRPDAPPLRVRPHHGRLAILGVDGLPEEDLRLLAAETGSPVARWGGAALEARDAGETLPVAWVSVATGVRPAVHGVVSVRQLHFPGGAPDVLAAPALRRALLPWRWSGLVVERAVPAARRRVPTVWEMASGAGMEVLVAGWWGSFPPRRVTGLAASVRWLLTGTRDAGTVFPPSGLGDLPEIPGRAPLDMDRRAAALAASASGGDGPDLVMAYFPGWWLARRAARGGPLTVARTLRPHVALLLRTAAALAEDGRAVWIVALDGHGGGWAIASTAAPRAAPVRAEALAPTWLDALGLPVPPGSPAPRRDLSGVSGGGPPAVADYGPPPPLAGATPRGEGAAQLELIETLGYLR